ncbi:hypothetical protein WN943_001161 [Citrus x changshan-huyou]
MIYNGYYKSKYDSCVYHGNINSDGAVYLLLYIDDILIVGKNSGGIEKLKNLLKREFKMKDSGNAKRILGIDILRDRATAIKYLTLTLFVIVSLFLSFASTNSITKLDSKISATATATTTELNNTGSKEGSFANMIDHALEKKFNKSEQNEAADPGSFNNMLSDSMLVTFNHVFNLDHKNGAEDTPTFIYRKRRLISNLVIVIVSATCGGIAFVCSGQQVIIGYLLVGSVISPRGFSFVSEMVLVETVAQFGVIFLPFALGLEFSMAKWIFVPSLKNIDDFLKLKICAEALS